MTGTSLSLCGALSGVRLTPPTFAESEEGLETAATARVWQTTPSLLLGLPAGSVEAWVLDRSLASRLLEQESGGSDVEVPEGAERMLEPPVPEALRGL